MFHVISLQRTASKALVSALHKELSVRPDYVSLAGDPLSEVLHAWPTNGEYTFAKGVDRPFGHEGDVVYYKTHPKFNDVENVQFALDFLYRRVPDRAELCWRKISRSEDLFMAREYKQVLSRVWSILRSEVFGGTCVLKTQLSYLLSTMATQEERNDYLVDLHKFHKDCGITTIHLTRVSPLAWVKSMLLTEASGVFVASAAQREALKKFKSNPIEFPSEEELQRLHSLWVAHQQLAASCDYHLTDAELQRKFSIAGMIFDPPENVPEFTGSSKAIKNEEVLADLVYKVWGCT